MTKLQTVDWISRRRNPTLAMQSPPSNNCSRPAAEAPPAIPPYENHAGRPPSQGPSLFGRRCAAKQQPNKFGLQVATQPCMTKLQTVGWISRRRNPALAMQSPPSSNCSRPAAEAPPAIPPYEKPCRTTTICRPNLFGQRCAAKQQPNKFGSARCHAALYDKTANRRLD